MTEGLLLLTTDGVAAHRLTHPSHAVPRTYVATVQGNAIHAARDFRRGIELEDGIVRPQRGVGPARRQSPLGDRAHDHRGPDPRGAPGLRGGRTSAWSGWSARDSGRSSWAAARGAVRPLTAAERRLRRGTSRERTGCRPTRPSRGPASGPAVGPADIALAQSVMQQVARRVVGQEYMVERLLISLLTGGHVLLEGVPGLAKTLTVRTLAETIRTTFARIQFTPDLLPADVIGTQVYDQSNGQFSVKHGPIFANIVLADEINRAPAKVQAALLEAMQEKQVTIGGTTYALDEPFLVLATQNPIEQEGTYPLPEAQVDRFMMKLRVGYPTRDEEKEIMRRMAGGATIPVEPRRVARRDPRGRASASPSCTWTSASSTTSSRSCTSTRAPADAGLQDLVPLIEFGASPRATIALAQASRAHAFLRGRELRHARRRQGDRAGRAAPPGPDLVRGGGRSGDQRSDRPARFWARSRVRERAADAAGRSSPAVLRQVKLHRAAHAAAGELALHRRIPVGVQGAGDGVRRGAGVPARRRGARDRLERHRPHAPAVRQAVHRGAGADRHAGGGPLRLGAVRHGARDSRRRRRASWRPCSRCRRSATTTAWAPYSSPIASSWSCRRAKGGATRFA